MIKIISLKLPTHLQHSKYDKIYDVTIELKQCIHERSLANIITVSEHRKKVVL